MSASPTSDQVELVVRRLFDVLDEKHLTPMRTEQIRVATRLDKLDEKLDEMESQARPGKARRDQVLTQGGIVTVLIALIEIIRWYATNPTPVVAFGLTVWSMLP